MSREHRVTLLPVLKQLQSCVRCEVHWVVHAYDLTKRASAAAEEHGSTWEKWLRLYFSRYHADDHPLRREHRVTHRHSLVVADNVAETEKNDPEGFVYCSECGNL